jgi:ADP-ribose pyrophosphatase
MTLDPLSALTPDPLPQLISSRRVYEGWVNVRLDSLRYASGLERDHTIVEHPGGVTLVAFDAGGLLLMVRQHRHATGRWLLELPAGTLDPGEPPQSCAERELREETGYRPRRIERLGGFYTAPGFLTEYLHVFLCTELVESPLEGDEDVIHLERLPLDEALSRIASGEIADAKTSGALLLYLQARER